MKRLAFCLLLTACNKETTQDSQPVATSNSDQKPVATEPVKAEPAVPQEPQVTCDSLGIPSYDYLIRELTALRCESCHGDKLAFNGVKLQTYQDYQTYGAKAKTRIETNMLTKPLDPIEQGLFLTWFEKGMPRTEKDCANKG